MMASQVGTELGKDEFGYRTVCVSDERTGRSESARPMA